MSRTTDPATNAVSPQSAAPTGLPVVVGGTIAIDHVKTPDDEAEGLLGGSASYAALAASYFTAPVHLVGIVGADFPPEHLEMLEKHGISLAGVERSPGESFSWSGEYHENMNERTTHRVAVNVLENWHVKIPQAAADAPIVLLANMAPENQLEMLSQCTNPGRFVISDTMDLWIDIARPRLLDVLKEVDLFVLNDSEARTLAETTNLLEAAERLLALGPRFLVIKLGEHGAMLVGKENPAQKGEENPAQNPTQFKDVSVFENIDAEPPNLFRTPAFPLRRLVDPTGAGDSFLGAMAGFIARSLAESSKNPENAPAADDAQPAEIQPVAFDLLRRAVVRGTIAASFTCEAFSTRQLENLPAESFASRLDAFHHFSRW